MAVSVPSASQEVINPASKTPNTHRHTLSSLAAIKAPSFHFKETPAACCERRKGHCRQRRRDLCRLGRRSEHSCFRFQDRSFSRRTCHQHNTPKHPPAHTHSRHFMSTALRVWRCRLCELLALLARAMARNAAFRPAHQSFRHHH